MKRIISAAITLCILATMLCLTAFAATDSDTVMQVSGQKEDGSLVAIKNFTAFNDGWNYAMEKATDHDGFLKEKGYVRIVVDLLADWHADDGEFDDFFNGAGFDWDAIYFAEKAKITLNMNNHTIDRGLTDNEYNGEVMCVDEKANVIINDGTITGGNSDNGAGGIHIKDNAIVTLNNVNIINNETDGDDGGGIAVYDGAILEMNGGSFVGNINDSFENNGGAAVYIEDSTATFNSVRFFDNQFTMRTGYGAAVYAAGSTVMMDGCEIVGNGLWGQTESADATGSYSTIRATNGSTFTIKNSTIKGNGSSKYNDTDTPQQTGNFCSLFRVTFSSKLYVEDCIITDNLASHYIFDTSYVDIYVNNTTVKDNFSPIFVGHHAAFTSCTFNDITQGPTFKVLSADQSVTFSDCEMGNSTYNDINKVKFLDSDRARLAAGSIFGEGSVTMLLALLALVVSVGSVCLTVVLNKKKAAAAGGTEKPVGEE